MRSPVAGLATRIRRADDPFSKRIKGVVRGLLQFHLPVAGPTRFFFGLLYRLHVLIRELTIWASRFFWYEPLFRSQCETIGERFQMEKLPYLVGSGRILIGSGVRMSGKPSVTFSNRGQAARPELRIGDDTFIGHGCAFSVAQSVRVGSRCLLAAGVYVQDQDGHPLDAARRAAGEPTPPEGVKPVTIGDDVWVGSGAMILKGVTIGDRAMIGARSVVTRDVPPDTIVAGNPARVVKQLSPAGEQANLFR